MTVRALDASSKPTVLALHGAPRVGKDTLADWLVRYRGATKLSYADPLYETVADAFGVPVGFLRSPITKTTPSDLLSVMQCTDADYSVFLRRLGTDLWEPRTSRFHLVSYGTEYVRSLGESDRWSKRLLEELAKTEGNAVISDLRAYRDGREIDPLRRFCADTGRRLIVIEIQQPGAVIELHESNDRLPAYAIDATIVNRRDHLPSTIQAIQSLLEVFRF